MTFYVVRRVFGLALPLFLLITATFLLIRSAPGGPLDGERDLPADVRATIEARYHLDESLTQQYLRFWRHLLRGDLGPSFRYPDFSVTELIAQSMPVSLQLGAVALAVAVLLGGGLGILAAGARGSLVDRLVMLFAALGVSLPAFVTGPLLILLFAIYLDWLPPGGWSAGRLSDWVMPVCALALPHLAVIARLMRGSMVEVLSSDFIQTARAKGASSVRVLLVHALRPALLPIVSYLAPAAVAVLTGSVVIEVVFGIPGMGRYLVQGALNRDYTLVMGVVIVVGVMMFLVSIVADILYAVVDPRIRMDDT